MLELVCIRIHEHHTAPVLRRVCIAAADIIALITRCMFDTPRTLFIDYAAASNDSASRIRTHEYNYVGSAIVARQYLDNRKEFNKTATSWTEQYAKVRARVCE